ncbi:TrkH family potassium uptake protein [Geitlerinema sp. PCC 9228]|jgi:trk system potassium uptake protein TrkH|uniref:TrkH family potassium uptake protein n=1 Tax=Geitlerinema sp. PCC 9228 TaxID=111611 RepID=UPI0008F9A80F|nr:TrkH family potassium uptake protein [Geitlerinema sp. PCC 9228]
MNVSRTVGLGFLTVIGIGTILLAMPFASQTGDWTHPVDALFTATSATCVTGLVVVDTGDYFSFWGQLVILILIQVGGLGYMTATTFLLLLLGRQFRLRDKVAIQKTLDTPGLAGLRKLILSIIGVTLFFEAMGVAVLLPVFRQDFPSQQSWWLAIFHSISAFNNAGFSTFADSLMGYARSLPLNAITSILIVFGGLGYQVIMEIFLWLWATCQRFWKQGIVGENTERFLFSLHFKIVTRMTLYLLATGSVLFLITEWNNPATLGSWSFPEKLMGAWFQSVTTRTAGFNTIDISQLSETAILIAIVFMFLGASPGGTGGGIKTTTLRVLFSATRSVLRGRNYVLCHQRKIPQEIILKSVGVLVCSLVVAIAATFLLSISDRTLELTNILFEVVSAFGTVGLSLGITSSLSVFGKLVITATMFVGRVGVLLLISAIVEPAKRSLLQYPEENLLVG